MAFGVFSLDLLPIALLYAYFLWLRRRISAFAKLLLCLYTLFRSAYLCLVAYNGVMFDHMVLNVFVDVVLNLVEVVVIFVAYLSHEAERMPMAQLQD